MEPLDVASLLAEPAPLCWDRLHATNGPVDAAAPPPAGDALDQALPWLVRHLGVADALTAVLAADAEAGAEVEAEAEAQAQAHAEAEAEAEAGPGLGPVPDPLLAHRAGAAPRPVAEASEAGRLQGALQLIGFDSRLRPLALDGLDQHRLPALLLLRCGDACVLTGTVRRGPERLLRVVMPGRPPVAFELPRDALAAEYTGVALLLRRRGAGAPVRPPEAAHGPLARLALALEAALALPAPAAQAPGGWHRLQSAWRALLGEAGAWHRFRAAWRARPAAAFKFGPRRPISG